MSVTKSKYWVDLEFPSVIHAAEQLARIAGENGKKQTHWVMSFEAHLRLKWEIGAHDRSAEYFTSYLGFPIVIIVYPTEFIAVGMAP